MKKLSPVILLITLLCSCTMEEPSDVASTHVDQTADSLAILENFEKQAACWNEGDLPCYMEAYDSANVQTISSAGITRGYARILGNYQRYFPKDRMGKLHFDELELKRLSDQYYYVIGRFNLFYEKADTTIQGWFSVLMEKKNSRWLMISDHSS